MSTDTGANPLVAGRVDSTEWYTGIGIAEGIADLANGVESGSWIDATIGGVATSLEALGLVLDPLGSLVSYGVAWLIEHVKPLSDALDWLAGDPDQIKAYAQTWRNVAKKVSEQAGVLSDAVRTDIASWSGDAATAYRAYAANHQQALGSIAKAADTMAMIVEGAGLLVALVRELVRDAIADFVSVLVVRLPVWTAEVAGTLGVASGYVVGQVGALVAKWAAKISGFILALARSIKKLMPILRKLDELIAGLKNLLRGLRRAPGSSPTNTATNPFSGPSAKTPDGPSLAGDGSSIPGTKAPDAPGGPTLTGGPDTPGGPGGPDGSAVSQPGAPPGSDGPGGQKSPNGPGGQNGPGGPLRTEAGGPRENTTPRDRRTCALDPVDVVTGAVVLTQFDVRLPGTLPLVLQRMHVSSYRVGGWFGRSWASTLDQRLEVDAGGVCFATEDGMTLVYPTPPADGEVLPVAGPHWPLRRVGAGYAVTDPERGWTRYFAAPLGGGPKSVGDALALPIIAITDRNDQRIDFRYTVDGTVDEVRHSGGYRVVVDTADGRVTALRLYDPAIGMAETVARFGYDETGDLRECFGVHDVPQRFDYDADGRLVRWEDRTGTRYEYGYDAAGRCVRTSGSDGFVNGTVHYGPDVTTVTDSLGNATRYHLNDQRQVVGQVDPLGNTVTRQWDEDDRLLTETDALGRTTVFEYDAVGNLSAVARPDGARAVAAYNDLRQPTSIVDFDGSVWRRDYDDRANLTAVTDPGGAVTRYRYGASGHLAGIEDPLGNITAVVTDAAGLAVAVTDPLGATTSYERDCAGRVAAVTDPLGGVTRHGYTVDGKPAWRELPDGARETWAYDGEGNLVEYVDPAGAVTRFEVTHFDLPAARVDPDGTRYEFGYDTELRLTAVTNPQGLTWRYEYDPAGRLVAETDFNGRALSYVVDGTGQLVARTNGVGQRVGFERDVLGNVTARQAPEGTTRFGYDAAGRLTRASSPDVDLVVERDRLGRVLAETVNGRRISYVYDAAGRRLGRRTPSGVESVWAYDARHQPTELETGGQTLSFIHDAAGRQVERRLATDRAWLRLTQSWDAGHRLLAQTLDTGPVGESGPVGPAALVAHRAYRYRPDGLLAAVDDLSRGRRTFALDPAGRITAVDAAGWRERYAYDSAGNLASAVWDDGAGAGGDREYRGTLVRRAGNVRYEHDAQGRVVLRQQKQRSEKPWTWRYTWDSEDRLTEVVTPDGTRWAYRYDPLGRRVGKYRLDTGDRIAEWVEFSWDGMRLAEQTSSAARTTTWEYCPGSFTPIAQTEQRPPDGLDQAQVDERFYAIVSDLTGAPAELVTPDGQVAWHTQTTIWGTTTQVSASGVDCPLRFPGQYHDPETGDHYNNQRYYDPTTARYHSADPFGLAPSPNPHAYVRNPTRWTDPLGLMSCEEDDLLEDFPDDVYQGVLHMEDEIGAGRSNHMIEGITGGRRGMAEYLDGFRDVPRHYVDSQTGAEIIIDRADTPNPVVIVRQDLQIHAYHVDGASIARRVARGRWTT